MLLIGGAISIKSKCWNKFLTSCQKVEVKNQLDECLIFFTTEEEQLTVRVGVNLGTAEMGKHRMALLVF